MYKEINLNQLLNNKLKLLIISQITKEDIKSIFKLSSDPDIGCDFEYHYNIPLYAKMIQRFKNNNNSVIQLHNQITPGYQNMLRGKYHLYDQIDIFNHFAWMENSLGSYHILALTNDEGVRQWKQNSIQFFFGLERDKQLILINDYNENVKKWNNINL